MTIEVDHGDGQRSIHPAICPEVEGGLPSEMIKKLIIGRGTYVSEAVVASDQGLILESTNLAVFQPAEAIGTDELSHVAANRILRVVTIIDIGAIKLIA